MNYNFACDSFAVRLTLVIDPDTTQMTVTVRCEGKLDSASRHVRHIVVLYNSRTSTKCLCAVKTGVNNSVRRFLWHQYMNCFLH